MSVRVYFGLSVCFFPPPFLGDVTLCIVCADDGLCVNGASVVVLLYRNWTVLQRCAEITD